LRVIVVLVVPAIPPPSPQSRASTAPITQRSPPLLVLRDVRLTTTTHTTKRALCIARTRGTRRRSRLGAAGSLPAGGGGGGGCLAAAGGSWGRLGAAGGGWGRLASRGAGGQRRRRRWGDFGLNTGIFFSETIFFGASQVALCGCRGGVKTTKISHQEKDGYLFSPTTTSMPPACPLRSGSAVEAQRMRSGCGG
jgi:hypothetical protein